VLLDTNKKWDKMYILVWKKKKKKKKNDIREQKWENDKMREYEVRKKRYNFIIHISNCVMEKKDMLWLVVTSVCTISFSLPMYIFSFIKKVSNTLRFFSLLKSKSFFFLAFSRGYKGKTEEKFVRMNLGLFTQIWQVYP
jgi:uncharacterized membrane protein